MYFSVFITDVGTAHVSPPIIEIFEKHVYFILNIEKMYSLYLYEINVDTYLTLN